MLHQLPNGNWIDPAIIHGIRYVLEKKLTDDFFIPSEIILDVNDGDCHGTISAAIGLPWGDAQEVMRNLAALCNQAKE